jgi:biopolymer transport protein ExbD
MIDVVFLLISFFMIVGVITSNEIETLYLPAAKVPPDNTQDPERFILNITRDGKVVYRGQYCDPDTLKKFLLHEAAKHPDKEKTPSGRTFSRQKILVRADQDALYDFVQLVMVKCTEAGIINLQFGVKEKREG